VLSIVGLSLPLAIERLLPDHGPDIIHRVNEGYRSAFGELRRDPANHEPLYEGMEEVLRELAARDDVLLGVATGKSLRGVEAVFERLALKDHFVTVQTADFHPSKPHPSMIETAIREAGVEAGRTIMIGDTTFDIEMARGAGVGALGVGWGYHPVAALKASGADDIVQAADTLIAQADDLLARHGQREGVGE
jgi:phosphoglycolate phosphatase